MPNKGRGFVDERDLLVIKIQLQNDNENVRKNQERRIM
ncbi:hypothetical protein B4166_2930 [Caldibacillus thermoamylovorans]|uniref:Transposase n=1 Tax=Caldibacillus thermoamylovorans TaxID=35841 RepID=A0ABD4A958_9BACI|nr:hypothetical protein B4166_2930 [Caldibacillus thermoamylovorans]KIO72727.1 hypothetical protein B4167_2778 [Caldibacillus thermoamylovorans]